MKFEDAYCEFEHCVMPIHKVSFMYNIDAANFSNNYKNSFWCPECRIAQLSYHNAATPYFSTYPNSSHAGNCSLQQDEMSASDIKAFVGNNKNREKIMRQMDSLMHLLLSETETTKSNVQSFNPFPKQAIPVTHIKVTATRRFPRKRIDAPFRNEDFNCYKFFYGDVILTWEKNNACGGYKIILRSLETKKFLCRINITDRVYSYIHDDFKLSKPFACKIVFLACMQKTKKNYLKTSLRESNYLNIHKI